MAKEKQKPSLQEDLEAEMLLKEADEALRQDKLDALWQEWGGTLIGIALMLVFGTMMGVGWKNWRHSVNAEQTAALVNAQGKGVFGLSIAESEGIENDHKGIMHLLVAGEITSGDDVPSETWIIVKDMMKKAADKGLPTHLESIALWTTMRIQANNEETPEAKTKVAEDMITLADDRDNPYTPAIMIEAATLYGENENPQKALDILSQAETHDATEKNFALRELIQKLKHLYTVDLSQKGDAS